MRYDGEMKHWFKRKRYGYGWVPVTWQGWLVTTIYAGIIILGGLFLNREAKPVSENLLVFFTVLIVATGILFTVTHYSAPSAKWRWGKKQSDDPDEDF